jgi:multisubunit Na+/H+ antiporter MnhB subunit
MKLLIKKIVIIIPLSAILIAFIFASKDITRLNNDPLYITNSNVSESKNYFLENTFKETGSKNIVTGIYLEYRLFDTIFEAGILLITVTGIIFISKKD